LAGAGGTGIRFWTPGDPPPQPRREYLQEFIEGQPCAAIYVGNGHGCWLVGVTQQLIGETWLGAAPFHYCGSIGPMLVTPALLQAFGCLGSLLTEGFGIRGLFGVDCVVRDGYPYPVEVNPRYTASIEVLEYASGSAVLDRHCFMFEPELPEAPPGPVAAPVIGKAILFARDSLTFPADGPWMATLRQPGNIWELPDFADIPAAGTPIPAGRPILTFFVRGDSVNACQDALQQRAAELNRWLFP
jgi:predicted ATP-grasp superfamily ATP-dependent carboligase